MMCAWNKLLGILPLRIRAEVDKLGKDEMQELRLRINAPPELILGDRQLWLEAMIEEKDLSFVLNTASRYSPWAAGTMAKGFLSVSGGHRIGICGEVICKNGSVSGIQTVRSLCIRVARDYEGIARSIDAAYDSILIVGAPGWGKTTLLRDLIRQLSQSKIVAVVDERGELFPEGFPIGRQVDILTGCSKVQGIEMLLRTMGPQYIAVDEITAEEDCQAIIRAANCGVQLLATCHGTSLRDLNERYVYRRLMEKQIFHTVLLLNKDKSYIVERMTA